METVKKMVYETLTPEEQQRSAYLKEAQNKAFDMFKEIEATVIRSGVSEKQMSDEIHDMGQKTYNVRTHWHKRVVRSGPNTLAPFAENPPDRMIEPGDILYIDLGPVFEAWEADFGRTFVLGDDPDKNKLKDALEPTFYKIKERYQQNPDMTGGELYAIAGEVAKEAGYEWGAWLAGHTLGDFPHERIPNDMITLYICEKNDTKLSSLDKNGHRRHWILEVHLHDKKKNVNGFYEQLLTVD